MTDVAQEALPDIRDGLERLRMGLARLKEALTQHRIDGGCKSCFSPLNGYCRALRTFSVPTLKRMFSAGHQPETAGFRRGGHGHRRALRNGPKEILLVTAIAGPRLSV